MEINHLIQEIDKLKIKLNEKRILNNPQIIEALNIEYTYDSNKIEGNTLTLRETELIIHKGITIGGKSLVEHLEAINHYEAIGYITDLVKNKETLTQGTVKNIHSLILKSINQQEAGKYRSVPVLISGSKHIPTAFLQIENEMQETFEWYEENKNIIHPVILSAEMHERIVTIHPFIDGNGRTSRLIMNLILLQNGYPIANIGGDLSSRLNYYNALEKSNIENNKDDFILLIANYIYKMLKRLIELK